MSTKRKQSEVVTPPQVTRNLRRRFLSETMSSLPEESQSEGSGIQFGFSSGPAPSPTQPGIDFSHFPPINLHTDAGGTIDLTSVILTLMNSPAFAVAMTNALVPVLTPVLSAALGADISESVKTAVKDATKSLQEQVNRQSERIGENENAIFDIKDDVKYVTEENQELNRKITEME